VHPKSKLLPLKIVSENKPLKVAIFVDHAMLASNRRHTLSWSPFMVLTYIIADECREQITTLLTDLGCTQADVSVCVVDGRSNFSVFFFFFFYLMWRWPSLQIAKNSPKLTPESLKRARLVSGGWALLHAHFLLGFARPYTCMHNALWQRSSPAGCAAFGFWG